MQFICWSHPVPAPSERGHLNPRTWHGNEWRVTVFLIFCGSDHTLSDDCYILLTRIRLRIVRAAALHHTAAYSLPAQAGYTTVSALSWRQMRFRRRLDKSQSLFLQQTQFRLQLLTGNHAINTMSIRKKQRGRRQNLVFHTQFDIAGHHVLLTAAVGQDFVEHPV